MPCIAAIITNFNTFVQYGTDASLEALAPQNVTASNAVGYFRITTASGTQNISSLTVNGVQILAGTVTYTTSKQNTANLIVASINAGTGTHGYVAFAKLESNPYIYIVAVATGTGPNGYVVARTATFSSSSTGNMAGGGTAWTASTRTVVGTSTWTFATHNIGTRRLAICGSLTWLTGSEMLMTDTGGIMSQVSVELGGTLTIGSRTVAGSGYNYPIGIAAHLGTQGHSFNPDQAPLAIVGTLHWYTGVVQCAGGFILDVNSSPNFYSPNARLKSLGATSDAAVPQIRQNTPNANFQGFTNEAFAFTFIAAPAAFSGYVTDKAQPALMISGAYPANTFQPINSPSFTDSDTYNVATYSSKWWRIINSATGSNFISRGFNTGTPTGLAEVRQGVSIKIAQENGTAISGALVWARDVNNGLRLAANLIGTNADYTPDFLYSGMTNVSGIWSYTTDGGILIAVHYRTDTANAYDNMAYQLKDYRGLTNTNADTFTFHAVSYGYQPAAIPAVVLKGLTAVSVEKRLVVDANVTANVATAASYTDRFTIDSSGNVTVTADATLDQLYDHAAWWIAQSQANAEAAGADSMLLTVTGNLLSTGKNITVNTGVTLSSGAKFQRITTTGTLTLTGAMDVVSYTSPAGTFVQFSVTGVRSGTKVRLVDNDTDSEVSIGTAGPSGYTVVIPYSGDQNLRADTAYQNGLDAEQEADGYGTLTATGGSIQIQQSPCTIYEGNAVNGSTVTGLTLDVPNVEIDADEADNTMTVQEVYAWYKAELMTDQGIRSIFKAITPTNSRKYVIDVDRIDLHFDNKDLINTLVLTGGVIQRSNGTSIRVPGSGSIEMLPDDVYETARTEAGIAAINTKVSEVHAIQGLDASAPMTVTPSSRVAGSIALAITGDGETTSTVTRT